MGDKNFKESQALQRLFGQVRKAGGQGAWDRGAGGTQFNQQSTEQRRHEPSIVEVQDMSAEMVRELLDYDLDSGVFTWRTRDPSKPNSPRTTKSWNTRYAGRVADSLRARDGYLQIGIAKKNYLSHRLAWLHFYGVWPDGNIDHINGIRTDNRIANLRDVPAFINNQNIRSARKDNKLGLLGVYFDKKVGKYRAQIRTNGTARTVGWFVCKNDAHQAYLIAKRDEHKGCTI